jgi:very-short-patch-repair endonuclease
MLDELAERGRTGITTMREVLAERGPAYRPPESGLEARAFELLARAGIRGFERQVDLGGRDWLARVDLVHRVDHVVVQIDSDRYHSSLIDCEHDAAQTTALEAAGYLVVRVRAFEIWHQPWIVVERVRAAQRHARCLATPARAS